MDALYVILVLAFGFYLFFGAFKNYDWFFSAFKMQRAVEQMGRENARKLYMVTGIIVMIVGIVMIFV